MDHRHSLPRALKANYSAIIADVGGRDDVSHIKNALAERSVWPEAILQTIEHEMSQGQVDKGLLLKAAVLAISEIKPSPKAGP
jgi:hypothetical protein